MPTPAAQCGRRLAAKPGFKSPRPPAAPRLPRPPPPTHARRRTATGRGAQTVYRDRETGRVVSAEEFAASRAKKGKVQYEEVHLEWKGGLAQAREREAARAAVAREAGKAFGRCGRVRAQGGGACDRAARLRAACPSARRGGRRRAERPGGAHAARAPPRPRCGRQARRPHTALPGPQTPPRLPRRGFDADADSSFKQRSRWGDPMAGRVRAKGPEADLPPPVVTEANRAALEASGGRALGGLGGARRGPGCRGAVGRGSFQRTRAGRVRACIEVRQGCRRPGASGACASGTLTAAPPPPPLQASTSRRRRRPTAGCAAACPPR